MRDLGCVLAFDFGEARIGVAVGEGAVGIAHPLETIATRDNHLRFQSIEKLVQTWSVAQFVVGLPTHDDGRAHEMTRLSVKFAQRLRGRFERPVFLVDERFSSHLASSLLNESGRRGRRQKAVLDQVAAQAILQSFFDYPETAVNLQQYHLPPLS